MPIALQTQLPSQTDYAVRMSPATGTTQVAASPFALTELVPGLYLADTADTDVFADGRYRLEFIKGGQPFSPPLYDFYELKDGAEASLSNISTAAGGLTTEQNDRLLAIPTNPLLADSYTAPDNDAIAALAQSVAAIPTTPAPAPSAIASAVESTLGTQLDTIAADAAIARKGVTNNKNLNLTNDTGTLYDDDNETPVVVFDLAPSAIDSTSRTRRP
jgi:hypothetical protein